MAKAGKQTDAAHGMMPAQMVRARSRRTNRALVQGALASRVLTAIGVILIVLLAVGAVGAADVLSRLEFHLAPSDRDAADRDAADRDAASEAFRAAQAGPSIAATLVEVATTAAIDQEASAVDSSAAADSGAEPKDDLVQTGQNQLWLISTRRLPDCPCVHCDVGRVDAYRYECGVGWQRSSREAFLAADGSECVTSVFIHGNDTDAAEARAEGHELYRRLTSTACPSKPVRFVIWSWPSERVLGRVRSDIQAKACRSNVEAFYLADFLDGQSPDARVSLSGYSLGARVAVGALHLLGGGVLDGRQREARQHPERPGARVVLIAAAMADDWLLPGMRYERALSQTERMVVMYNPHDNVLRFYPFLYSRGGPNALGYTGISNVCRLDEDRQKVCELNVSGAVHRGHGWGHYVHSPSIICRLRNELLMHDTTTVAQREEINAVAADASK